MIESIFSGMSRAVIQNSAYQSVDDAKAAVDRYFNERNAHFKDHPRRAGAKIWGKEPGRQSPTNDTAPGRLRIPACIAAVVHKVDLLIGWEEQRGS